MRRQVSIDNFLSRHSYVDVARAAIILGIGFWDLDAAIERGELTCYYFSGKRYILKRHLKAYYEQRLQARNAK